MKKVEIIEIWKPTKGRGEAFNLKTKTNLKRVAMLANGHPVFLEKDYCLERSYITKEEADKRFPTTITLPKKK